MSQKFLSSIKLTGLTGGSILKINADGVIVEAVAGTDYITSVSAGNLDSLTDVVITSPSADQILVYGQPIGGEPGVNIWYNKTPNYLTPASSINALGDVSITSVGVGNLLSWNGSNWVNWAPNFLTSFTETDPVFAASPANTITTDAISNWNTAYGWGNHAIQGYLTSFTETDPTVPAHVKTITENQIIEWDTAYGWGDHKTFGYLTSYTETDPIYTASSWYTTTNNSTNWNTAYGWGNHAGLYIGRVLNHTQGYHLYAWPNPENWYTIAKVVLNGNCQSMNLFGEYRDLSYWQNTEYKIHITARAECDFLSNNESHNIRVNIVTSAYSKTGFGDKVRVVLTRQEDGVREYELQYYRTTWDAGRWELQGDGWTIYDTSQTAGTALESEHIGYNSNVVASKFYGEDAILSNGVTIGGNGIFFNGGTGANSIRSVAGGYLHFFGYSNVYFDNQIIARGGITNDGGDVTVNDNLVVNGSIRSAYNTNDGYTYLTGFGVEFDRLNNYLRPVTNGDKTLYIGGASAGLNDWNYVVVRANSFQYNGNEVATQSWVSAQGYITSETDSQTLEWNQGEKTLTISNGNSVDLGQMASVQDVEAYGFITGESDTLATVTARGYSTTGGIDVNGNLTIQNSGYLRLIAGADEVTGFTVFNAAQNGYLSNRITTGDHPRGWGWELTSSTATSNSVGVNFRVGYAGANSYLDSGNFGINTTNPQDFLHIRTGLGWGARITYTGDDSYLRLSSNQIAAFNSSNGAADLYLNNNSSGNVLFTGGGNVGIGTNSPTKKLHISTGTPNGATSAATNTALLIDSSGDQFLEFRTTAAGSGLMQGTLYTDNGVNAFIGYKEYTNGVAGTYGEAIHIAVVDYSSSDSNNGIYLGTTYNPTLGVTNPQMFIKGNGNVGIGTTTPSEKLEVHGGNVKVGNNYLFGWRYSSGDSNMYNYIYSSYDDTTTGIAYRSGSWTSQTDIVAHNFQTYSGGWTSRLAILQNGNIGIGTTDFSAVSFGSPALNIYGSRATLGLNSAGSLATIAMIPASSPSKGIHLNQTADGSFRWYQYSVGAETFTLNASGNVGIGYDSPSQKLHVNGTTYTSFLRSGTNNINDTYGASIFGAWTADGKYLTRNWHHADGATTWDGLDYITAISDAPVGNTAIRSNGAWQGQRQRGWTPIDRTKTYKVSVWFRTVSGNPYCYASLTQAEYNLNQPDNGGWGNPYFWNGVPPTEWTEYTMTIGPSGSGAQYTWASGTRYAQVGVLLNYLYDGYDGEAEFSSFKIEELDNALAANTSALGHLYVNGGITSYDNTYIDGHIYIHGNQAIDGSDSWLRLNQNGNFSSGVYTPGVLRNDGNFVNYGGIYGYANIQARKAQTAGNYTTAALWTESYDNTTTGIAFHISGNVGKFLEMRTDGILYWNGDTVLHSGNYSSWALPKSGGVATGWVSFSSHTQGTPIIKAVQEDASSGYYLFQGVTGSSEVFRVDRTGSIYSAGNLVATQTWISQQGYAVQQDIAEAVSNLVNSSPEALDTLGELANALGNDPNFATTVTNSIATKAKYQGNRFQGDLNTLGVSSTSSGIYSIGAGYTNGPGSTTLYGTMYAFWNEDISVQIWPTYNGDFYWRKSVGASFNGSTWRTIWDTSHFTSTNVSNWDTAYGWGNHAGLYIPINPDGDGPAWSYSDANPEINGVYIGGTQMFGADGDALTGGALQARMLNAYDGSVNSAYGYHVGNLHFGNDSEVHATTQVINSAGTFVGPQVSTGKIYGSKLLMGSGTDENAVGNGGIRIGRTDTNYTHGSSWSGTSSTMFIDCSDVATITIHDSGHRLVEYMTYDGAGTNTIFTGRNIGWGTTNWSFGGDVSITGSLYVGGNTVWNAGNDGSGSGLDADYLDGYHASSFAIRQDGSRYSTDFNGILSSGFYNAEGTPPNAPGSYGQLIVAKGIDTALQIYGGYSNNELWFRGWGYGPEADGFYPWRKVWHDGNDGSGSGLDADTVDGVQGDNIVYGNARGTNDSVTTNADGLDKTGYYTSSGFTTRPSGVSNWMYIEHIKLYNSNTRYQKQIGYDTYDDRMWVRTKNDNTWTDWKQIWTSGEFANNSSNWDTAYGWGNHATANYWVTSNTDPQIVAASSVTFQYDVEIQGQLLETSSLRFKENIVDLEPVAEKVNQLRPVRYNKIGSDVQEIGLIAEEVSELFPEVVHYNEDGEAESLNYTRLSVLLLQTVKELSDRIQKLENK